MDALQRARVSRRGSRSFVTKLLSKAQAITDADEATPQTISEPDRETIDLILNQLSTKKRQLEELDETILAATTTEKDLEDEVTEVEMYHFHLTEQITSLQKFSTAFVAKKTTPSLSAHHKQELHQEEQIAGNTNTSEQQVALQNNPETEGHTEPDDGVTTPTLVSHDVPVVPHTHAVRNVGQFVTRLPKLTLPTFSGDPLQFQTFWDSFEAAVHNNEGLTGIQKFHYLRAQLLGDAAQVIDNFPLTDMNYLHSVTLLKDRFGQPYKLVSAHMDALMNLPKPVNNLASL